MSQDVLPITIGYDAREDEAFHVCRLSLIRRASRPLYIQRLWRAGLSQSGIFDRPWHFEGKNRIDERDGKPFSTEFSFTRFLVPALAMHQGWALFCDGDFLFTADIAELFALADDRYAAMVVKHRHDPVELVKMDGIAQTRYRRKNWSSLVLWNCAHPSHRALTLEAVNLMPGAWLHGFSWLQDEEIGSLPRTWNYLCGAGEKMVGVPKGIHYTLGTPNFPGYENGEYAELWLAERDRHLRSAA